MEKSNVDLFLSLNGDKFPENSILLIKERLELMDSDKLLMLQTASFRNPTTILLIAIFLGWERFFLDEIGLGILKIVTCYGFMIWWLIDIFTAQDRTKKYNLEKFLDVTSY